MDGFKLVARFQIKAGQEAAFASAVEALTSWVKDNEPGVHSYEAFQDGHDAAFLEHYSGDDAFMSHMGSKAGTELLPAALATVDIVQIQTFGETSDEVSKALEGFAAQQFGERLAPANA